MDGVPYSTDLSNKDPLWGLLDLIGLVSSDVLAYTYSSDDGDVVTVFNQTSSCLPVRFTGIDTVTGATEEFFDIILGVAL